MSLKNQGKGFTASSSNKRKCGFGVALRKKLSKTPKTPKTPKNSKNSDIPETPKTSDIPENNLVPFLSLYVVGLGIGKLVIEFFTSSPKIDFCNEWSPLFATGIAVLFFLMVKNIGITNLLIALWKDPGRFLLTSCDKKAANTGFLAGLITIIWLTFWLSACPTSKCDYIDSLELKEFKSTVRLLSNLASEDPVGKDSNEDILNQATEWVKKAKENPCFRIEAPLETGLLYRVYASASMMTKFGGGIPSMSQSEELLLESSYEILDSLFQKQEVTIDDVFYDNTRENFPLFSEARISLKGDFRAYRELLTIPPDAEKRLEALRRLVYSMLSVTMVSKDQTGIDERFCIIFPGSTTPVSCKGSDEIPCAEEIHTLLQRERNQKKFKEMLDLVVNFGITYGYEVKSSIFTKCFSSPNPQDEFVILKYKISDDLEFQWAVNLKESQLSPLDAKTRVLEAAFYSGELRQATIGEFYQ